MAAEPKPSKTATGPAARLILFGTDAPLPKKIRLQAGSLAIDIVGGAISLVEWHGTEVLRGLSYPVRNSDWGTWSEQTVTETSSPDAAQYTRSFVTAGGALDGVFTCEASADGTVKARVAFTALRNCKVNRAGFVILHPIAAEAGTAIRVTHPDGQVSDTAFPKPISPGQPVMNIRELAYDLPSGGVRIVFGGDVFEMEDQRNWSDASFKTYCRPLAMPYPYAVHAGETWVQTIDLRLSEHDASLTGSQAAAEVRFAAPGQARLPRPALAHEPGWPVWRVAAPTAATILLRVNLSEPLTTGLLANFLSAPVGSVELEAVVPDTLPTAEAALRTLRRVLDRTGCTLVSLTVLPAAYLISHQPVGPWPAGASPRELSAMARSLFPDIPVGGGVLTNFTELNRLPDRDPGGTFVTYGTTAIVHAADDRAVMQTLEALPQIHASAAALYPGMPLRLGLSAIAMRSNPYGSRCAPNPEAGRIAMAMEDPRQKGLFAATFMVGVIAATDAMPIERIALGSLGGAFGLTEGDGSARPAWHVFRMACALAGTPRLAVTCPPEVVAFAAQTDGHRLCVVANITDARRDIAMPHPGNWLILNQDTAANATDPLWLQHAPRHQAKSVRLEPYAVAFGDMPDPVT